MEIHLKDLSHSFDDQQIFDGLSFTFEEGNFYLLKGDSGCGKSTLLKMMVKLQQPQSGTISYSTEAPITELRRKAQLLPQLPVIFSGSVLENLMVPYSLPAYKDMKPALAQIDDLLEKLFPEGINKEKDATTLSQGQKQRLAVGRVLLLEPEVMLCDEPTSALDSTSRKIVDDCINQFFIDKPNRLVVYISHHDDNFIATDKTRSIYMTKKRISEV